MNRRYLTAVTPLPNHVLQVDFVSGSRLLLNMKPYLDKIRLCAQLRVCSQAGGIPVYPRFSQPDNSESWDDAGNGI